MITLYVRDADGICTGGVTVNPMGPIPPRSVLKEPPLLIGAQVARWSGSDWEVLPERPQPTQDEFAARNAAIVAARWESIKSKRDGDRAEGGVQVGIHWFHTDTASRIKWLGLKDTARDMLAGGASTDAVVVIDEEAVLWKTMAGDFVAVTVQMALDVVEAAKVLDKQLFKRAEQHYALMTKSADPGGYDYSSGWPIRFSDLTEGA